MFIVPGEGVRKEVPSMPGIFNLSVDEALKDARESADLGLGGLLLFGIPPAKDDHATGAWSPDGIVQQALRALKSDRALDSLVVIADACLCEYTSHGHCGVVAGDPAKINPSGSPASATSPSDFSIDNDASLALLAKTAVSLAHAGADIVAPSDMMDGRVAAIREALDSAALINTPILSYAAKVASAFYGPFREAADSTPQFGDRRTYQMDGGNLREAMREIAEDVDEGADMLLIKPALPYLDVLRAAVDNFGLPTGAYQVSGEYAMLQAAFARNWLAPEPAILESLISIRRAGADFIVTYFAQQAAKLL
jgi:porphobilinogen synthase